MQELLNHRVAEAAAQRIVNRLVNSIKTPPHSPEPITTTVLVSYMYSSSVNGCIDYRHVVCYSFILSLKEEDVFRVKNPGVS